MLLISICVIMKNEEKHLETFLSAIEKAFIDYPYEIVVVDTGSTDDSVAIAKKHNVSLFYYEWNDDFSAAKNFAIKCAKNDWILVLDCDEYIVDVDTACFEAMSKQFPEAVGLINMRNHTVVDNEESIYTDNVERFFNRKIYHYESIVHEHLKRIDGTEYDRKYLPLKVEHYGYSGSYEDLCNKVNRNNKLLFKMLEDNPDDPYLYFQIGQSYKVIGDNEKTCFYFGKGLEYDVDPKLEYVKMMVNGYGYALLDLGRNEEALGFEGIYEEFADDADFVCLMGIIYLRNGLIDRALEEFNKATTFKTSKAEGCNSYIPYFNMGCIYEVLGDFEQAKKLYEMCGAFTPAIERLRAL